ncbi:MAG: 50S ribosomal protein L32 [Clostridia bacterium]|nr:50S ribosomal protein L32 [Clostridia bacterium]
MAVPKSKVSKSRRNKRAANWKIEAVDLIACPQCGELIQSHRVCKNCGYYDGKQAVEIKQKSEK